MGDIVTVVKFKGDFNLDLDKLSTKAKKIYASGCTFRDNTIEVQGEHRFNLKKFLVEQGFSQKKIRIKD